MKQRIISAFFAVILLAVIMVLSSINQYALDVAVVIISSMAIYEVISALKLKEHKAAMCLSVLFPLAAMLFSYFDRAYLHLIILLYLLMLLLIMLFNHQQYSYDMVSKFFFTAIMITLSFIHISYVRRMEYGMLLLFIIFIGCWITDTCAYFTGMAIGKHKLAPKISPKKTIEGSVGGIIGVTVIITAYTYICANIIEKEVNTAAVILIGLLCGILSQFGDLCASIIKREHSIKDFGNIMPGHGGVMDRFDSFLFVAPVVYYILKFFPVFI